MRLGAHVTGVTLSTEQLEFAQERMRRHGVADRADLERVLEVAREVDVLVANAGIGLYGDILDHSDAEIERMMHTNYDGTVWAIRAAVPAMLETAGGGDIVIVSSGAVALGRRALAMKPGKPFAHGRVRRDAGAGVDAVGDCHFIGLPGNPVSSFMTFLLLVRPFLLRLQGAREIAPRTIAMPAHFTVAKADRRREFLRARRNPAGGLDLRHREHQRLVLFARGVLRQHHALIVRSHAASHGVSKDEDSSRLNRRGQRHPRPSRRRPKRVCSSG